MKKSFCILETPEQISIVPSVDYAKKVIERKKPQSYLFHTWDYQEGVDWLRVISIGFLLLGSLLLGGSIGLFYVQYQTHNAELHHNSQ